MITRDPPNWVKREVKDFHKARIEILRQLNLDKLIATRSAFFRSGEITIAGELIYHVLDEYMMEQEEKLFDALSKKLGPDVPQDKIGYYVASLSNEYEEKFNSALNRVTNDFLNEYSIDGKIDWRKLAGL
ncbi:MAG: hypothetical protein HUU11_02070 [Anaerolineales bacterium]|nr:hypothetical protein [Anaerolineales bacterium]